MYAWSGLFDEAGVLGNANAQHGYQDHAYGMEMGEGFHHGGKEQYQGFAGKLIDYL